MKGVDCCEFNALMVNIFQLVDVSKCGCACLLSPHAEQGIFLFHVGSTMNVNIFFIPDYT